MTDESILAVRAYAANLRKALVEAELEAQAPRPSLPARPAFPSKRAAWGGAGVLVMTPAQHETWDKEAIQNDVVVVTPHARIAAQAMYAVRDDPASVLNHFTKLEMYGRMGEAMQACIAQDPQASGYAIKVVGLREALKVLANWELRLSDARLR